MTSTYDRTLLEHAGEITDEGIELAKARIGVPQPELEPFNEVATPRAIKRYADAVGDLSSLWRDEIYARKSRWGTLIAPPYFMRTMGVSLEKTIPPEVRERGRGALAGVHQWWSGDSSEWFQPVRAGEKLWAKHFVSDVVVKHSEFAGRTVHSTIDFWWWNEAGQLVAITKQIQIQGGRERTPGERQKYADVEKQRYTESEIIAIEAAMDKEVIRGAIPRYWEDVQEGEELTPVVKGPLTVSDIICWVIATGSPYVNQSYEANYEIRKRHPLMFQLNSDGIPDLIERVHWEDEMSQKTGNPAAYDYNGQRPSWLAHLVTNWMGDDGFLKKMATQLRRFNYIGDTTWCKGKVLRKYEENGMYLVDLELWCEDQRGRNTAPCTAVVALPSKVHGPVVLPDVKPVFPEWVLGPRPTGEWLGS